MTPIRRWRPAISDVINFPTPTTVKAIPAADGRLSHIDMARIKNIRDNFEMLLDIVSASGTIQRW